MEEITFNQIVQFLKDSVTKKPYMTPILLTKRILEENEKRVKEIRSTTFFSLMKKHFSQSEETTPDPSNLEDTERFQLSIAVFCLHYTEMLGMRGNNMPDTYDYTSWRHWFSTNIVFPPRHKNYSKRRV